MNFEQFITYTFIFIPGVIKKQSNEFKKEYQKSRPDSYSRITWDFDKLNNKNDTNSKSKCFTQLIIKFALCK